MAIEHRNSLQPEYSLHEFTILDILGQGGFGITYLARDNNLNRLVAIKEYLPMDMAVRENNASIQPVSNEYGERYNCGLKRFIEEARTLARFKHPNIVQVYSVFTDNNTAYMVMEYERGESLPATLKQEKTLAENELRKILLPILDGLEHVHTAGFIHRDIKPANIFIREDSNPVLLDFGSARQSLYSQTATMTTMFSPGFAPFEQYTGRSINQGPWTDIYGLGATLYKAITGRAPADAMDRGEALLQTDRDIYVSIEEISPQGCSSAFLRAIDEALRFRPSQRPISISAWLTLLNKDAPAPALDKPHAVPNEPRFVPFPQLLTRQETEEITATAC
jgi:serine/threonine protein kinase